MVALVVLVVYCSGGDADSGSEAGDIDNVWYIVVMVLQYWWC